ncbi:Zn(2)-C6 fungal-type domain-containing protein [Mycena venus]|uniref:Zn(2)-C6 fungal-type domain-containing protein n=1 Tax=Mycena venus TaxID=2733690 RepID=A0A8H6XGL5_9AGAR|nr:Zn(2)-C6 fungal-type domain-containing protein [Mycena venus]
MSSSAIPHVVAFLTRPLLSVFPTVVVSSAQLILTASLASVPSATYTLNATSTPAPLLAASIGAGIPWSAWLSALGSDEILLFYGPGYVKIRLGDAAVTDIWSEEHQGSVVPISRVQAQVKVGSSPLLQQNTGARLRAMLLSARVRSMRRHQAAAGPIRIPSLPFSPTSDSDSSDSDSDSDYCDSDSASSTSSKFTSYSNDSPHVSWLPTRHARKIHARRTPSRGRIPSPIRPREGRREALCAPRRRAHGPLQEGHDRIPLPGRCNARHDRRGHARPAPRRALYPLVNDVSSPASALHHDQDGLARPPHENNAPNSSSLRTLL